MGLLNKTLISLLKVAYAPTVKIITADVNGRIRVINDHLKSLRENEEKLYKEISDFDKLREKWKVRDEKRAKAIESLYNESLESCERLKLSCQEELNKINSSSGDISDIEGQNNKINYLLVKHPKQL